MGFFQTFFCILLKSVTVAILLKNALRIVFFENVLSALIRRLFAKKQKIRKGGKYRKNKEERKFFFEEKTFPSLKIASLPKWLGAKHARC